MTCTKCDGTGNHHHWTEDDELQVNEDEPCGRCNGSGSVECGVCGGSGGQNVTQDLGFDSEEQFRDNMF